MKKLYLPSLMILLAMIFGTFSSTLHAQQLSPNAPVVAASLSVAPDISGLCIGSTVLVPIHITGDGVLSLNLYIEFDHSVLAKAPGAGYANLFPGFNALYNYAYSGAFPTVSYLDISSNELIGTNFTGEKLMDLAFVYMGGSTTIHFRTSPNPTPPPLCKMFDEFGTQILPVTYTDNLVSGYPNLTVGTISGNQTICSGIVPAQLTGTPPSNGTSPTYQWQSSPDNSTFTDITGATSINFQPAALSATTYYRLMQNATGTCTGPKPTNTVTIAVNPLLPVSLTIAVTANPVCAGTVVTYSATPVNGGSSPVYHWKIDGGNIPGATSSSFINIPSDGDVITCELTSNATCASGSPALSSPIAMIVNPILPVAVAVTPSANPVCAGTAVTYTAAPINGGTTPVYQWMVNGAPVVTLGFLTGQQCDILFIQGLACVKLPEFNVSYGEFGSANADRFLQFNESFFKSLSTESLGKITYRPYPVNSWPVSSVKDPMISYDYQNTYLREYLERCKDIVTVPGNSKVLISQSKLVIVNYLSTAYLEALISDVPTVFFWNKESYFLDDKYSDFYDLLISVGICQTDPVKAANFIDIIADCAEDWWLSDSVRKARNSFLSVNFGEPQKMVDYLIELARL